MLIYLIERQVNISIKANRESNFNDRDKNILSHKDSTLYKFVDFIFFIVLTQSNDICIKL